MPDCVMVAPGRTGYANRVGPAPRAARSARMYRPPLLTLIALAWISVSAGSNAADPPRRVDFERDVRPILARHCLSCHGPSKQKGGLRFDRKAAAMNGGNSGPAIVPGKGGESPIVQL